MEQMRSELLQEKAAKQDLECDKISLERQVRTASSMSSCLLLPVLGSWYSPWECGRGVTNPRVSMWGIEVMGRIKFMLSPVSAFLRGWP